MVERLAIERLGHRGDGIADTAGGPLYVPYTVPGDVVDAEPVSGHPDRRHLLRVVTPSRIVSHPSARISESAAAARFSIGARISIASGSAVW